MPTICNRKIFTKKCRQQQNFDSDPKEVWHYNHVTFTPIAKNFIFFRLTIKVKVGIPETFKVGWYPHKITGSSYLKHDQNKSSKLLEGPCILKIYSFLSNFGIYKR